MRFVTFVALTLAASSAALADDACPTFGGDAAFDSLLGRLRAEKTCPAAVATLKACRWGSSADTSFAAPVVARCEGNFYARLSPVDQRDYAHQMQRCAYRYAANQGTLFMSAAALCQVDVAAAFAGNPNAALRPARASFDCARAAKPLERLICADDNLGQADIILAASYADVLAATGPEKASLVASEKRWLAALPARCHVGAGPEPTACVIRAFEARFTALNQCIEAGGAEASCLDEPDGENAGEAARASFDCQAPRTPLEIVICADAELGQADIKLAAAYRTALDATGSAGHDALMGSERVWLRRVAAHCPLGAVGSIPPVQARACVRAAFSARSQQLGQCASKPAAEQAACLDAFRLLPKG